ncbi:MAG: hypothetical protein EON52_25200 [Actinomycetales bacterium]|nr:MAG: hypothetical protein EON52_25200 [Actinomycetales bacterium]
MTAPGYAALSRRYAAEDDVRMAQLASWAGDVHTLERLLQEQGADLPAAGAAVAAAVETATADLPDRPVSPREVVELARRAMVAAADPSVRDLLVERLDGLRHLDLIDTGVGAGDPSGSPADRLGGRSADELWSELRTVATDSASVASHLAADGAAVTAGRLSRRADAAAYEAYLVLAAMRSGDVAFATVDLRWDLLADTDLPVRARFSDAVGAAERGSLHASLETT